MKKITFIVDRDSGEYTGLAYSYIRSYEKNGYQCSLIAFNIDKYLYKALGVVPALRSKYLILSQNEIVQKIKETNAGLVFVVKGYFLLPATIVQIKNLNKTVICFNPDSPFNTSPGSSNSNIRASIRHYDAYLIWNRELLLPIEKEGCKKVFYLPFAADIDIINPPVNINNHAVQAYTYDLSFVGNADEKRIKLIKSLSGCLKDWKGKKAVFGKGWKKISEFYCLPVVTGQNYLNAIHQSKINLNILREQNKNSHNMRTFEIPAAGGFMLHEYSEEAIEFFKEGVEAEFFRDAAECADKIKYYFKNDNLRNKIAKAGYEKIFSSSYTYVDMAKLIEKQLDDILKVHNKFPIGN